MTTMDWHLVDRETALQASMPRVERAIDRAEKVLALLREKPDDYRTQESYCLCTRKAEALLRATWADRGGHYRLASVERLVELLESGLATIGDHRTVSEDGKYSSQKILESIGRRLKWVRSLMPREEGSSR